jgi:phage tail-like protein
MPVGIMIHNDAIYVGANERRRLVKYALDGTIVGEAVGYEGPVAGLAADACGGLWLHPGDGSVPVRLSLDAAFVERGVLWGGPFGSPDRARDWHRLKALGIPVESGAHFRFFIYASDKSSAPPVPPDRASPQPFDPAWWREFPHNLADILVDSTSRFLWIGALFESDGARSPQIEQVRLSFDHQTYSKHLPAIYSKEPDVPGRLAGPRQLDRFLSLFESFFTDVEETIGSLDRLLDPDAVPADWLDWLAGWLALELEEDLPIAMKRQALAEAFGAYAWRGTSRGLRAALRFYAGVEAHVEEPIVNAAWWSLPPDDGDSPAYDTSVLGFSTRLVAAEPQGAVLGTTAVLDASQLITQEEFGGPLFEEVAHQFSVQLYRSQPVESRRIDEVRRIIDREKPAHTACHICLIEPRMRIGFQCILGVDTVVSGGTPSPSPLGEELNARAGAILAGNPAGRIGPQSRVGQTTWLGAAPRRPSDCSCDVDNTLDDKE